MRLRRPMAALAFAALLATPGCRPGDELAAVPVASGERAARPAVAVAQPARLCDALPDDVVAAATGRSHVIVDGAGTQCSWRSPAPAAGGTDVVLQGSFIDARSYDLGRTEGAAWPVLGLGDDAYVVRPGRAAPTTLYVRDGHRALALWLDDADADPARAEAALAELARRVLAA